MKKVLLVIYFVFICSFCNALNVKIIESQSYNVGHVMDTVWLNLISSLGHTATIEPQLLLNSNAFFATTDVLIISSGVITLPANYVTTIQQFLQAGKPVYIQAEYLKSYSTTAAFESLVNILGGTFAWGTELSGDLAPVFPQSTFANTPNSVASINYYWYGVEANTTPTVSAVIKNQNFNLGLFFCPPTPCTGKLITTTDQDWIRAADPVDLQLMENIFYHLIDTTSTCNVVVQPNINFGNDTTLCNGDSLVLNVNGTFNSYTWQNGSTNSSFVVNAPGTYYVSAVNTCDTKTDTIVVAYTACGNVPAALFSSSDTLWCDKTCIDFYDLSQNTPTTWQWYFAGASPTTSTDQNPTGICYNNYGSFDVVLVACNSVGCDSVYKQNFVTEFQLPAVPTVTLSGDTLNSSPANSYQWFNVNNVNLVLGTNNYFVPTVAGSYYVLISDSNGCQTPSAVISIALSVPTIHLNNNYIVYDNANHLLQLKNINTNMPYAIHSADGKICLQGNTNLHNQQIDVSSLARGIYTITIYDGQLPLTTKVAIY